MAAQMAKLLFMDWFVQQHGPRERGGIMANCSDAELKMEAMRGEAARAELRRRELWDEKQTSALYAWQVNKAD